MISVLPIYASILAFLYVYLSVRTIRTRRKVGIGLGHGDSQELLRAIRVHANFAEYVPLSLVLIFLLESTAGPTLLVHALGASLVAARLSHAFGVSRVPENFIFRVAGMGLTFTVMTVSAAYLFLVHTF